MREDQDWLSRWEEELPSPDDLMPLNQNLITPDLAAAFKIHQNSTDSGSGFPGSVQNSISISNPQQTLQRPGIEGGGVGGGVSKRLELEEEESSVGAGPPATAAAENGGSSVGGSGEEPARTLKRPRLVWTPQLHKRFVDAVGQLGIKNAVPKTIMQLMNVDGLTRENVASHLQKYRLYLKRVQGFSSEGPSSCDHLFASTPVPSHFLPREDVVVPLVPMLGHAHLVSPGPSPAQAHHHHPHHYAGFDPRFLGALPRQAPNPAQQQQQQQQQRIPSAAMTRAEYVVDDMTPVSSPPPRQVLTLFPTGDN
eukprot:TRINITY_DN5734_c0_g2_i1.p1 TRINITY_DN5734_c0_g2~~TRINITY_DN5734_c0_g2_i1.p1  ORF type:complete len:309 (-),score=47.18 TRINITY_DN5734_c0_g2_i1:351-1277(-)